MVTVTSFGYKHGDMAADVVVDCRGLPNPYAVPALRPKSGLDAAVAGWVLGHPEARTLVAQALAQVTDDTATIAVGCAAGRHRSVAVAEVLAEHLGATAGHRDLRARASWSNGTSRTNSKSWKRLRRRAKRELPYVCAVCFADGEEVALELDHVDPDAEGGSERLENAQWLCVPHHAEKTKKEAARGRERYEARKKRPQPPHPGLKSSAPK